MAWVLPRSINHVLATDHYLGPVRRGIAWQDEFGVLVLASPTSRRIPQTWLELVRWCLKGTKNGGSQQWARVAKALKSSPQFSHVTTVVSYSDPSVGHTGALYKSCNWQWAPTWHRLRPPPSGNGDWGSGPQSVKDRWIYPLRPDPARAEIVRIKDNAVARKTMAA